MNKIIAALGLSILVSACGSETNKDSATTENKQQIAVQTSGFEVGERITLKIGDVSTTFLDTQFMLPPLFEPDEAVNIAVTASPEGKSCVVNQPMPFIVTQYADQNVVTVSCSAYDFSGYVQDYNSDARIEDVTVQVVALGSEQSQVSTDESGYYHFSAVADADLYVLNFSAPGYGDYSTIYYAGQALEPVNLVPVSALASFPLSSPLVLPVTVPQQQTDIVVVSLPANSLVTANGSLATGTAEAIITLIDPSNNASLMPGHYTTVLNGSNDIAAIESFGAVDIVFKDDNGNRLQLADGQTATIRIPIASGRDVYSAPANVPLYYFDTVTGHWVEEGLATKYVGPDGDYYEGSVSHFTTWNADQVINTVFINGCVENKYGETLANVKLTSSGIDYIGMATTYSNDLGQFRLAAKENAELLLTATSQNLSLAIPVTTQGMDMQLSVCLQLDVTQGHILLTWDQYPTDLDSHLWGPLDHHSDKRFHVYYGNPTKALNGGFITLDVDDKESFGPEIIHLTKFPYAGSYSYYVHHYTDDGQVLPERVKFSWDDNVKTIIADLADKNGKRCWHVFDVYVDDEEQTAVTEKNDWVDDEFCLGESANQPN